MFPITSQVIKIVEDMAEKEGVSGLKFYDKNGQVIMDGDLLAGVDPDDLWDDDEDYTPNENERDLAIDMKLRNENIPDDELQDLMDDLNENNSDDEDSTSTTEFFNRI